MRDKNPWLRARFRFFGLYVNDINDMLQQVNS